MKFFRLLMVMFVITLLTARSVSADEIAELKVMVEQLRSDYESKIQALEAKIGRLEASQGVRLFN